MYESTQNNSYAFAPLVTAAVPSLPENHSKTIPVSMNENHQKSKDPGF
jgi:hypothetical protein